MVGRGQWNYEIIPLILDFSVQICLSYWQNWGLKNPNPTWCLWHEMRYCSQHSFSCVVAVPSYSYTLGRDFVYLSSVTSCLHVWDGHQALPVTASGTVSPCLFLAAASFFTVPLVFPVLAEQCCVAGWAPLAVICTVWCITSLAAVTSHYLYVIYISLYPPAPPLDLFPALLAVVWSMCCMYRLTRHNRKCDPNQLVQPS